MVQNFIKLSDYESAVTSLGMLCEMHSSYVVSYAKMLNVCGQQDFAVELLESYVELYPNNKKAKFVLEQIRPENETSPVGTADPAYANIINNAMHAIMGN